MNEQANTELHRAVVEVEPREVHDLETPVRPRAALLGELVDPRDTAPADEWGPLGTGA